MMDRGAPTQHARLLAWTEEILRLTQPDHVESCDGSQREYDRMFEIMLSTGTAWNL